MERNARILIAGHRGMVGAALMRRLSAEGYSNIFGWTRSEVDLRDQRAVLQKFANEPVDYVLLAAATVGGIVANAARPVEFLYDNLMISANVIHAAAEHGVKKLLFLGSSCIYPKLAPQPIVESSLLGGPLEPTNEAYALAKIAGLKLCSYYNRQYRKKFISAMPTNLYGPGDNFHPTDSHVIPGLLRRFHEAKVRRAPEVAMWGSGSPLREFLHVDDLASALVLLMQSYDGEDTINVGSDDEVTIAKLGEMIKSAVGYEGRIVFDPSKPDGTPRKRLDSQRIRALGWDPRVRLGDGLKSTYAWALAENRLV